MALPEHQNLWRLAESVLVYSMTAPEAATAEPADVGESSRIDAVFVHLQSIGSYIPVPSVIETLCTSHMRNCGDRSSLLGLAVRSTWREEAFMLHPCVPEEVQTYWDVSTLLCRGHPSYFLRRIYLLLSTKIHSNSVCKAAYKSEVDFEIKYFY